MIDLIFTHEAVPMPTIREVRVERELPQCELARRAGCATGTIVRLEAGKPVSKKVLTAVCNVLEISPSEVTGVNLFVPVKHRTYRRNV